MTTDQLDTVIRKIQKLMALSRSSNPHEAAAAAAKAQELLLQHKIDMATVDGSQKVDVADPMARIDMPLGDGSKAAAWKGTLASAVSEAYLCKTVWLRRESVARRRPDGVVEWENLPVRLAFLGRKTDVEISIYMFGYLARQIDDLASLAVKILKSEAQYGFCGAAYWKTWRNNFRYGAIETLRRRLMEEERRFVAETKAPTASTTALMVLDKAKGELKEYTKSVFPSLHKRHVKSDYNHTARSAGKEAGEKVSLNRALKGSDGKGHAALTGGN